MRDLVGFGSEEIRILRRRNPRGSFSGSETDQFLGPIEAGDLVGGGVELNDGCKEHGRYGV